MLPRKLSWKIRVARLTMNIRVLSLLFLVAMFAFPSPGYSYEIFLGSGAPGSFSYFSGRVLCRLINNQRQGIQCRQVAADDELHNLTNLLEGSLDISLVGSRALFDAVNKTGRYEFLDIDYANLRALGPLYDVPATLIVRQDAQITDLNNLKGKRINAGIPQSPQYLAVRSIMQAKKWSKKDFSLFGDLPPSQAHDDTKAFCYGTMQAMVYVGIHPDFSLRQLLQQCDGRLLSLDDPDIAAMVAVDPALWMVTLAGGTYPSQPEPVVTFGTRTVLVTAAELDGEIAAKIIRLLDENKDCLAAAHPALALFSDADARKQPLGIAAHPSAIRYFSQH